MTQVPALKTQRLQVGGMDCTSCAVKIEGSLEKLAGVAEISVVVATGRLIVTYDPARVSEADIKERVTALGYTIETEKSKSPATQIGNDHSSHDHSSQNDGDEDDHAHNHGGGEVNLKREGVLVGVVIALFVLGSVFEETLHNTPLSIGEYAVFIPAYLLSGWTVLTTAGRNILRGQVFDENFLMTIATVGAIAIHKLPEAVGVMLFFKVGELFQESAVSRSRRSISALLEIRPDAANLKTANGIEVVSPERVKVGDTIIIKPGEKVPLDGEIVEGNSQVDTSALTGESVPRTVNVGETVLAGMINQSGVLTVTVTKLFGESSIARILDLVENATAKKAATEKLMTRIARRYTPIVVISSLLVALIPPLVIPGATRAEWVYRALILLVISCPCGLVISIPLSYFGGLGGAAKRGILVKGATFLDTLAGVKAIAFDKTGTLTKGVFKVTEIVPYNGFKQDGLLRIAAAAETNSNHPIAKSIVVAYERPIDESTVSNYTEIAAHGIQATIEGKLVLAGNDRLMHRENITHDTCNVEGTVVHLAIDGIYAGYIIIADEIKEDAVRAIRDLKAAGVERIMMLTGDSQAVAARIAKTLGVDTFAAELLPEDKVAAIEKLLGEFHKKGKVAFVGDGINDAPVIARADVGIAMGGLGSDAAIETADVVLMTDAPSKVAEAIQVGKKTHAIVLQNIIFALTIKVIFIGLGLLGLATMWEAVFADVGVALAAIFNATRVMK
ncbi:heavy metal translocating P-type ATPase [Chamaesiphon minutus]|uniref:P-type Zn(2+) transporter n=1 Tax=Chamaesiphon minutus (strain ATCC 27169 / PCC 6605) TaxID=1173020 RepID=K9UD79_CHAP6|nr:heavy metal translocating P-type ATPase [Chamaesiphon minutus]AFY93072.1 heavy metal-translocating P-type ATPase, Cd/Co/Hg/Pb/Zn-transporting [Chamaesiphon minutus PCC 6605]